MRSGSSYTFAVDSESQLAASGTASTDYVCRLGSVFSLPASFYLYYVYVLCWLSSCSTQLRLNAFELQYVVHLMVNCIFIVISYLPLQLTSGNEMETGDGDRTAIWMMIVSVFASSPPFVWVRITYLFALIKQLLLSLSSGELNRICSSQIRW